MLRLEARAEPSRFWTYGSPLLALLVTVLVGTLMFAALGKDPIKGLSMFFWLPIRTGYAWGEL
ncbi:MAG: ABC transporter permease, partial [Rhodoferax sp.]|nr:ABC transporter permease [Rhodoferax sp.]